MLGQKWWKSLRFGTSHALASQHIAPASTLVLSGASPEYALFLAEQQIQLIIMDQESIALPQIIQQLQQSWARQCHDRQLFIVYCYPFSHECFLYHAPEDYLGGTELKFLQQLLLRKSIQADQNQIIQQAIPYSDQLFSAKMIAKNHNRFIWRIYLTETAQFDQHSFEPVDRCLTLGLQQWLNIYDRQQAVLEQERREFAAELHDSIAQVLGFLRLKSAQLHQSCKSNPQYHALLECTHELANYTHYAYQQTRDLITASRLIHQDLDFSSALKKIIDEFSRQSAIDFELDNRVPHLNITAKQSIQLIYIIRESLSNIVRHSQATHARIYIEQQKQGDLKIYIHDDGIGMALKNKRSDSFGLEIMQERAERIGASLKIMPRHPHGTTVLVQLDACPPKEKTDAI
ncbi:hypothetical protein GCM10023206_05280 [Acinetobacter puyangensis]|uniref:histidine kinase n=1 Tax=Acinetobacter puyangensis TaxID=1096779 RepID=A0A240ECK7_9GAMM|nr:ATP-binding protein [Acinetobacter puyangensis]SNX45889.1 Histidine kinase-, DNA gyrase B-, and HSP90-like ATPase [Acinetobacter puyangensis]